MKLCSHHYPLQNLVPVDTVHAKDKYKCRYEDINIMLKALQQQQHSLFSQASWGRLEMKPERNKFKVQAH